MAPGDPEPRVPSQGYTAAEQQLQQQMSLGELCHPVPHSFEPVKSFFKDLVEAMQSLLQTPLDVRLKESKSLCDRPWVLHSPGAVTRDGAVSLSHASPAQSPEAGPNPPCQPHLLWSWDGSCLSQPRGSSPAPPSVTPGVLPHLNLACTQLSAGRTSSPTSSAWSRPTAALTWEALPWAPLLAQPFASLPWARSISCLGVFVSWMGPSLPPLNAWRARTTLGPSLRSP